MNLRPIQLTVGWLVLCALTSAGTFYGLIELDQQVSLQAKLSSYGSPNTGSGALPVSGTTPAPVPGSNTNPGTTPNPSPTTGSPPVAAPPAPVVTTPAPVQQPVYTPPQQQPVVQPKPAPGPGPTTNPGTIVNPPVSTPANPPPQRTPVTGLQTRFDDLNDRAGQIIGFFQNMETQLRTQGMGLRPEIKSAWRATTDALQSAQRAIRSGDAATATRALDVAEQKIDFLEQSK